MGGYRGGRLQEEEQEDPEVPEGRGWRHSPGHHGQEEPEARGQEGPERAGGESCLGRQGAGRFQEGSLSGRQEGQEGRESREERAEVCRQGRRQEINTQLLSSVVTEMSIKKSHQPHLSYFEPVYYFR